MSLLQETCGAIVGRNQEIEQHIIDSWNTASPVEQYGRLVNVVAQYGSATNQDTLTVPKPCMIIASADHGVADMGVSAKFAGLTAEEATGRGTNISDERLKLKQRIVHDVLEKYKDIPKDDAIGILSSVGGFEFACIVGVILGAAANNGLVIIDGFNTSACGLVAKTLVPEVMDYVMASHLSAEKAAKSSLENLGLEAYVDLGLCLGEASGSSVQMGMLDLAVHMYLAITGGKA